MTEINFVYTEAAERIGYSACYGQRLSSESRVKLAWRATPVWRGRVAALARGMLPEHRFLLALFSTPEWCEVVVARRSDIPTWQRQILVDLVPKGKRQRALKRLNRDKACQADSVLEGGC